MNNSITQRILTFLRHDILTKRWRKVVTCLGAAVVFVVTYAMILPAITMTSNHPVLGAETLIAWTGDELTLKVSAETEEKDDEKIVVLTLDGEGADLSKSYSFNEEGICFIIDETEKEIELHRAIREGSENTVDYWFSMEPGTKTVFTLNLADEVDAARFAKTMEAVKQSGEEIAAETATASDAGKSGAAETEKNGAETATPADAEYTVEAQEAVTASVSNAEVQVVSLASVSDAYITETDENGFAEIMDGQVFNDLESEVEDEEQTEIVTELKVSAGSGKDYESAVVDAQKNADKRGDAQLKFQWKDVIAKKAVETSLLSYVNGATIAVFYDSEAGIPEGAELSVREIEEGTEEYQEYLAQAKSAMETATSSNASKTVSHARFFDISILNAEGNEIESETAVKVIITYDEKVSLAGDGDLNVLHFDEEKDEVTVIAPKEIDDEAEIGAFGFTAERFSVYGFVGMEVLKTEYLNSKGETYEVTVAYNQEAKIPEGSRLIVTEYPEGSEKYNETRKAVLADKYQKGEWVDLNDFGFAALDISILNAAGEEIEPEAEVQVSMKIKSLPGVEKLEEVQPSLEVQHHVETADGVIVDTVFKGNSDTEFTVETSEAIIKNGIVVDPSGFDESTAFKTEPGAGEGIEIDNEGIIEADFETDGFSAYTITWGTNNSSKAYIHYGYMDGNTFVPFKDDNGVEIDPRFGTDLTQGNSTSAANAGGYRFLNYDFEGYEYDSCHINSATGTAIAPTMYWTSSRWNYANNGTSTWQSAAGKNIYVIYKKHTGTSGGEIQITGDTIEEAEQDLIDNSPLTVIKDGHPNGDGTNTISLEVEGHSQTLTGSAKADIILVYDRSASMRKNMAGTYDTGTSRAKICYTAVENLLKDLSSSGINARVGWVLFDTTVLNQKGLTQCNSTSAVTNIMNGLPQDRVSTGNNRWRGATNWEAALSAADSMGGLRTDAATFVIFLTDGNPTVRTSRKGKTNKELRDLHTTIPSGAPSYAFVGDGGSGDYEHREGVVNYVNGIADYQKNKSVFGNEEDDFYGRNFDAALKMAQLIKEHNKTLYCVGISNDETRLQLFNDMAGGDGYFSANSSRELEQALESIKEDIVSTTLGYGDVKVDDGITDLTHTLEKTGLVIVGSNSFTYTKSTDGGATWSSWTPLDEGCGEAEYKDGSVKWDMGSSFMPENGVKYKVEFIAWPSQEAYDTIAKLENGTLEDIPAEYVGQIVGNSSDGYQLITNTEDAHYTFKMAQKSGDSVNTVIGPAPSDGSAYDPATGTYSGGFDPVDNLDLLDDMIKVRKTFVNELDSLEDEITTIQLDVVPADNEDNLFKRILLTSDNHWESDDNYISTGLMKTSGSTLIIFESGHDFKLKEVDYHWDLETGVFRPAIINNQIRILERKGDNPNDIKMYDEDTNEYWIPSYTYEVNEGNEIVSRTVVGGKYQEIDYADAALSATNYRRSNLNLKKKVVDAAGVDISDKSPHKDTEFEFTLTVTNSREDKGDPADINSDYYVWFSIQDADNNIVLAPLVQGATAERDNNNNPTGYFYAPSRNDITVAMKPGWNLRFTNLPKDSTYTIVESEKEGYKYTGADLVPHSAQDGTGFSSNTETRTITGKIADYSKEYKITAANECIQTDITIYKTDADNPPTSIAGAVFSLFKKNGSQYDQLGEDYTNFEIPTSGKTFKKLAIGQYKLEEISAPQGYIVQNKETYFTLNAADPVIVLDSTEPPQSWASVTGDKDDILVIQNQAGVELPATGGPGTLAYTLSGIMLVIGSALMYGFRLRHGERRLK